MYMALKVEINSQEKAVVLMMMSVEELKVGLVTIWVFVKLLTVKMFLCQLIVEYPTTIPYTKPLKQRVLPMGILPYTLFLWIY